ncbi:MAG TPA: dipeptidase [Gemmatimonadales bacterium]
MRLPLLALPTAALLLSACTTVTAQSTTGGQPAAARSSDTHLEIARRVLREAPLVDGHNDLPWAIRDNQAAPHDVEAYDLRRRTPGHTDIERLKQGMVGGQFWSVYVPSDVGQLGFARVQLEQIDIARRVIEKYPELEWALTAQAIRDAAARGKVGSLLGMEGGHAIENSLGALRAYYDLGARYMTLTHSATIDWADAATGLPTHGGLTGFGEEVVREMNRLGMLVDLSHVSPGTMSDAIDVSEAPVIFSHSSARAVTDHPRNVPDSILRRMPANGGVVMITFVPSFVSKAVSDYSDRMRNEATRLQQRFGADTAGARAAMAEWRRANPEPRATMADVIAHIEHVRQVAGVDHVGIGGDFDGIDTVVEGLEDVSTYPALFAELSRRGWSEADLRKLAGENILRVMERAEQVSARLRQTRAPSTKTIEEMDGKK